MASAARRVTTPVETLLDAFAEIVRVAAVHTRLDGLLACGFARFTDRTGRDFVPLHRFPTHPGWLAGGRAPRLVPRAMDLSTILRTAPHAQHACGSAADLPA